ncbi:MAG: SemiSWEET transporter [Deltaproteobacteria bacterium]|nr:SemiSWEET transporter [Deltaproteobacteria bacterium]
MEPTTLLGLIAGTLTTASFLPQVVKAWRSRHTSDISGLMFYMLAVGIVLWLAYGIIKWDIPLMIANGVSLVLVSMITYFKVKYG